MEYTIVDPISRSEPLDAHNQYCVSPHNMGWHVVIDPLVMVRGTGHSTAELEQFGRFADHRTRVSYCRARVAAALDVYLPAGHTATPAAKRGRPAVLVIHGGSWLGGSAAAWRTDPSDMVVRLAQQGLVVFALDYRLARPDEPSWPAIVGDLREAVRWVRRHGDEFGVDPGRIVVLGISAGAHLAALLGVQSEERGTDSVSSRVQAVVSFYGPSDLASSYERAPSFPRAGAHLH